MGRPTTYNKDVHPRLVKALSKLGLTEEEVCAEMGISVTTMWSWSKKHEEFAKARAEGRAEADDAVQAALFKRAIGYDYEEVMLEPEPPPMFDDNGKLIPKAKRSRGRPKDPKMVVSRVTKKHVQGDVLAQMFWLKNRRPDQWKEKSDLTLNGKMEYKVIPAKNPFDPPIAEPKDEP